MPIGVASLAQVHVGKFRGNGKMVAVKLQHPHLEEFMDIDMKSVDVLLSKFQRGCYPVCLSRS